MPCRGHSGYPVTNFWRVDGKAIFFQVRVPPPAPPLPLHFRAMIVQVYTQSEDSTIPAPEGDVYQSLLALLGLKPVL